MKVTKAKTFKTNVELVTDVMEFSPYGALSQMFVIEAITRYAAACAAADPKKFDSPLLNGKAWVGVAKDIRDRFAANYQREPEYAEPLEAHPDHGGPQ